MAEAWCPVMTLPREAKVMPFGEPGPRPRPRPERPGWGAGAAGRSRSFSRFTPP